jgi:DNA-binding response OmpR family regulator
MAGETILHIGYDPVLIEVREAVLERHGYQVVSIRGNEAAKRTANDGVDLVIVGNGGRLGERTEIVNWLVKNWPKVPVLVMRASEDESFPEATVEFIGDTPNEWITVIEKTIRSAKHFSSSS